MSKAQRKIAGEVPRRTHDHLDLDIEPRTKPNVPRQGKFPPAITIPKKRTPPVRPLESRPISAFYRL
jgi:hypothetical protein